MIERFKLPNGEEVEFYPEDHRYIVNGIELPSITALLKKVYGDTYASVNPTLLQRSAEYGTAVHDELARFIELRKKDPGAPICTSYQEVENYFKFIEDIYKIKPLATEKVVVLYDEDHKPVAAGRFDLICTVDGKLTLADFKTTSSIHKQLVSAQLNLYLKAAYQSGYIDNTDLQLGAIHLSGFTSKYVPIPKFDDNFYLKFIK